MTFRVVNTTDWTFEQLAPYGKAVTACLRKLTERFPDDVTLQALIEECMQGARQLWLVFEGDEVVSVFLSNIRTISATGKKIITVTTLGGEKGQECVPDISVAIDAFAKEQGADYTAVEGRRGWGRELAKIGYREYAVVWRKPVEGSE